MHDRRSIIGRVQEIAPRELVHERERRNIILAAVEERPVATVTELVDLTGASAATIRRDLAALHEQNRLRRVRGGVEALSPPAFHTLAGRPVLDGVNDNVALKRAIAERAVQLCEDGDPIIINGGTTTYQMVRFLRDRRLQVFTNSFPIAEHLLKHSTNMVIVAGGSVYPELNVIISPFEDDGTRNFYARRMFMSVLGISSLGLMETDPMLVQAEQKLIKQADELVVLAESTKFQGRSSLILCELDRVSMVITDDGITDEDRIMLEEAGVEMILVPGREASDRQSMAS